MGDIIDLQAKLAERNGVNLSYVKNKLKPPMTKKGIKGFLAIVAPRAGNRYRLNQNQRKVQLYGRSLLGIATAIGIGIATVNGVSMNNTTTTETQEMLQEDDLMEIAENKLLECVFGDELDNIDNPNVIYDIDKFDGHKILKITSGTDKTEKTLFTYDSKMFSDNFTNSKEIVSLMNDTIDVHFSENVSKKKLEDLKESIEKCDDKTFKFKNGHIVEDKQIENDIER